MNAKQRTAANYVVISVKREEFQRRSNVGKFLNFIKENKSFAFDKSGFRVNPRNVFDNGFGRVSVFNDLLINRIFGKVDFNNAFVILLGKSFDRFCFADLSCAFYNKRFAIRVGFPIKKEFVDFTFQIFAHS